MTTPRQLTIAMMDECHSVVEVKSRFREILDRAYST